MAKITFEKGDICLVSEECPISILRGARVKLLTSPRYNRVQCYDVDAYQAPEEFVEHKYLTLLFNVRDMEDPDWDGYDSY